MIQGTYNNNDNFNQKRRLFECRFCQAVVYVKTEHPLPACPLCKHSDYQALAEPAMSRAYVGEEAGAYYVPMPYSLV